MVRTYGESSARARDRSLGGREATRTRVAASSSNREGKSRHKTRKGTANPGYLIYKRQREAGQPWAPSTGKETEDGEWGVMMPRLYAWLWTDDYHTLTSCRPVVISYEWWMGQWYSVTLPSLRNHETVPLSMIICIRTVALYIHGSNILKT